MTATAALVPDVVPLYVPDDTDQVPVLSPVKKSAVPVSKVSVVANCDSGGSSWTTRLSKTPCELFEPKPTSPMLKPLATPLIQRIGICCEITCAPLISTLTVSPLT